jgi:hypothetical protein
MEKRLVIPPQKCEPHGSDGVTPLIISVTQLVHLLRPEISTTITSNVVKSATTMKCGKKLGIFVLTAIPISVLMILWVPEPF